MKFIIERHGKYYLLFFKGNEVHARSLISLSQRLRRKKKRREMIAERDKITIAKRRSKTNIFMEHTRDL